MLIVEAFSFKVCSWIRELGQRMANPHALMPDISLGTQTLYVEMHWYL